MICIPQCTFIIYYMFQCLCPYQTILNLCFPFSVSASTNNMAKIEEMERLLREAQADKLRLLEHRVMSQTKTICICIYISIDVDLDVCSIWDVIDTMWHVQEREMEMRRQALDEERRRREDLEKRLQEETNRRQKLVEREVKLREKQRSQVFGTSEERRFKSVTISFV